MAEKLYYTMGEVAEMFDVNQSLLRHWEKQFSVLKPKRNKKGNRLFTPQDVERLKLIYHLVKERGMTLEGARKALRQPRGGSGVARDAELMERLQHIRSLLVEVREELKASPGAVYSAEAARPTTPIAPADAAADAVDAPAAEGASAEEAKQPSARKPRRKKPEEEHQELFSYYEQSLF